PHRAHRPRLQRGGERPVREGLGAGAAERQPGAVAAADEEPLHPDDRRRRGARHAAGAARRHHRGGSAPGRRRQAMMLGETVRVAFQSIRDHKLRALLTMLGIIIGVGAVIAVVAIGTGAQRAIQARIEALGANLLTIYPGQMFMMGRASDVRVSLLVRDAEALQRDARLLSAVEPELQRSLQVKYGNMNFNINVLGTTPNYAEVRNYTVPYGRMFTQGD